MSQFIGARIKALRKKRGLSQEGLARLLGFNDRQTVSAIETGIRRVAASELLLVVEKLNAKLEYFTDPFRLDGEVRFSWRQNNVAMSELSEYERTASRWIGAYRRLAELTGQPAPLMRHVLGLTRHSTFEDAMRAGERFASEFRLGPVPARHVAEVMQDQLGILVLMVDAYQGISGAACRLPEFDTVLIARGEVSGRRNFDLAHELFHILTWHVMPPERVENSRSFGDNHVEKLANSFAAALLMPKAELGSFENCDDWSVECLMARLNAKADELEVSSSALRWHLVGLRKLTRAKARAIPDAALRNNGGKRASFLRRCFHDHLSKWLLQPLTMANCRFAGPHNRSDSTSKIWNSCSLTTALIAKLACDRGGPQKDCARRHECDYRSTSDRNLAGSCWRISN